MITNGFLFVSRRFMYSIFLRKEMIYMGILNAFTAVAETTSPTMSGTISDLTTYLNSALEFVTGNTITMLFLGGSIVALAFTLVKKAKRSVK